MRPGFALHNLSFSLQIFGNWKSFFFGRMRGEIRPFFNGICRFFPTKAANVPAPAQGKRNGKENAKTCKSFIGPGR